MSDTAIRVANLGKRFQIGQGQHHSLRETLTRAMSAPLRALTSAANGHDAIGSESETARRAPRRDSIWALRDVTFEIKKGETVGIIGPNGSGKSTLLKLLARITEPTEGEIRVNGRVTALIELGAGFHPELTGRENIYLNGAILGMTKAEIEAKFEEIVEFAGLSGFIDTPVKHYSSGMYVRLGFAAAAHTSPDILLVDEVLAVGDALFQAKCFGIFREFKEGEKTVVLVTHNLDLVTTHCNRALLIHGGRVVEAGTPKKVVDGYNRLVTTKNKANRENVRQNVSRPGQTSTFPRDLEWQGLFSVNTNENRYGPRTAEIFEAGIFTIADEPAEQLEQNKEYIIKVKVRYNKRMPAAIVSYVIKDPKGIVLCGTNTFFQNIDMGVMEKFDVIVVTFRQIMRLNPGGYLLSLGVDALQETGYLAYDRRLDYLSFYVVGKQPRHGLFDLESTVNWSRCK